MIRTKNDGDFQPIKRGTSTIDGVKYKDVYCYKLDENGEIDDVLDDVAAVYLLRYAEDSPDDSPVSVEWGVYFEEVQRHDIVRA